MNKTIALFLIATCFAANFIFAGDTLILAKPISLDKLGREYAPGYLLLDNKTFMIAYANNNGFFNNISYSHSKYSQVYFRRCSFNVFESIISVSLPVINSGYYIIDSCNIHFLPISSLTGNLLIASSLLNAFTIENTTNLRLSLTNDSAISHIAFYDHKNLQFQLRECIFKDSAEALIFNSTLASFEFLHHLRSDCNVHFQNDTINGFIGESWNNPIESAKTSHKKTNIFTFTDCYINGQFTFFDPIPNSTIIFNNCTFGPYASLSDMAIDKIVIRNCRNFSNQILISFREKRMPVQLGLVNSILDNIKFDFGSNVELVFDSLDSKDAITNSYKGLLEKFEHEGKERSYKLVDLQYRSYKDSTVFHFLNGIWWFHGYKPWLVFIWTTGLLLVFFLLNLKFWKKMFATYPLKDDQRAMRYNKDQNKLKFYSLVLLYTFFIFFSLRVDLNKLNFRYLRFVFLFLFQYLIGLWCMVFIIRFIFKL